MYLLEIREDIYVEMKCVCVCVCVCACEKRNVHVWKKFQFEIQKIKY